MTPDLLNITYATIRSWRSQFGKAKCNELSVQSLLCVPNGTRDRFEGDLHQHQNLIQTEKALAAKG